MTVCAVLPSGGLAGEHKDQRERIFRRAGFGRPPDQRDETFRFFGTSAIANRKVLKPKKYTGISREPNKPKALSDQEGG